MSYFKRIASAAVALMLAVSALSGCGGKGESENVTTLNVWSHNVHSKAFMTDLISEWNETEGKKLGIKIEYTVKESDIQQTVDMAFESDQEPDFFTSCRIEKHSDSGNIVPIASLPGGEEFIKKYTDLGIDLGGSGFSSPSGEVYCVPFSVNTFGLVYNKDMFKKYGIVDENGEPTPPKTFDEVCEYAKRMTNESEQDYGIIFPMKWGGFYTTDVEQLAWGSAGRGVFDCKTGRQDFSVMKPIYDMYTRIKNEGSCFPLAESLDNDTARAYFAERNIGMKFAGSFDVGVFNEQFPAKCEWGVAPYPVADENERYLQYMGMGGYFAMSKSAVEKVGEEKAFEVFKFLHSDDILKKLYQKGMNLPYDYSIIDSVTPDENMKGWKEFAELLKISTNGYQGAGVEITGEKNAASVFSAGLWMGEMTSDEAIAELDERYNRGMDTYYSNHPEKDKNKLIVPDWNTKIDLGE